MYRSPEFFDKHGNAKPHFLFWLSCFFLARAWTVFVFAGVSREQGQDLLSLFYPDRDALYIGLALGFPAVILMLFAGSLPHFPRVFERVWRWGKVILISAFSCDLLVQMDLLIMDHWRFNWSGATTLLIALWLIIYLCKSRRTQFLFETPISRGEK